MTDTELQAWFDSPHGVVLPYHPVVKVGRVIISMNQGERNKVDQQLCKWRSMPTGTVSDRREKESYWRRNLAGKGVTP